MGCQRNRWIHAGQGLNGSSNAPWSELSSITNPDRDLSKGDTTPGTPGHETRLKEIMVVVFIKGNMQPRPVSGRWEARGGSEGVMRRDKYFPLPTSALPNGTWAVRGTKLTGDETAQSWARDQTSLARIGANFDWEWNLMDCSLNVFKFVAKVNSAP